jgi:hypothetical protein
MAGCRVTGASLAKTFSYQPSREKRGDVTHCTHASEELASCSDDTVPGGSDPEGTHNYSHLGSFSDEQANIMQE